MPKAQLYECDLNELLRSLRPILESLAKRGAKGEAIEFVYDLDTNLPPLQLDASMIEQVFINAVKSAIESMQGKAGATITIRTLNEEGVAEVIDNGEPITEEVLQKLFSLFFIFSKKEQDQGIGLLFIQEVLGQHALQYTLSTDLTTLLTHFTIQLL